MASNRAYDEDAPVEAVVADLRPDQPDLQAPAPSADALSGPQQAFTPSDFFVVASSTLNDVVGYLMERPWRETNHLLRAIDGVRSLDEYL